jgi:DNA polymerase-3 subunit delta
MKYEQLAYSLERGDIKPIYLLEGQEPYFIDELVHWFSHKYIPEAERDFNQDVFYAMDVTPEQVIDISKSFPMMSEKRLVILKEAQQWRKNQLDKLLEYAETPSSSTVLVIAHKGKKVDKRSKLAKAINKNGVIFESKAFYDNEIPGWIKQYVQNLGFTITEQASYLLSEYLGTEIGKHVNELKKLQINLEPGHVINEHDIEKYVGISKDYNTFELIKALGHRNVDKANMIAKRMGENMKDHPIQLILPTLAGFYGKVMAIHFEKTINRQDISRKIGVSMYFIGDYMAAHQNYPAKKIFENISIIRDFDLRSKGWNGSGTTESELLQELVYLLMH